MMSIRVLQVGIGPLGLRIADYIEKRKGFETVAAVDISPELKDKKLSQLKDGLGEIEIQQDLKQTVAQTKPDVALVTTVSDMDRITPQVLELIDLGLPVVSTCEELSFPWETNASLSQKIDEHARANHVAVVGTGVNPGFLMDSLPLFMTSVCQKVESIKIKRYQNASFRRIPFQRKIGAGLTLAEFEQRKKAGTLRHVGLTESMLMIANGMGWNVDNTEDLIEPVIAEESLNLGELNVPKGDALGVCQRGNAYVNGEPKIQLVFQAAVGEPDSYDEIEIEGEPSIKSRISGGVNGDVATCAIAINAIKPIMESTPGLHTMSSIRTTSFFESI